MSTSGTGAEVERDRAHLQTIIERQAAEIIEMRKQARRAQTALRCADKSRQETRADCVELFMHLRRGTKPASCCACGDAVLSGGSTGLCRGCK